MFDSGYGMVVGEAEGGSALLQPGELLGTVPLRLCASVSSGAATPAAVHYDGKKPSLTDAWIGLERLFGQALASCGQLRILPSRGARRIGDGKLKIGRCISRSPGNTECVPHSAVAQSLRALPHGLGIVP